MNKSVPDIKRYKRYLAAACEMSFNKIFAQKVSKWINVKYRANTKA
jgi:hypothetical protein